ncbi:pilus assembly protein [Antribacter sp. KLBMP9083]|uniref:Pilus assembly protein n=1 Tax=Antribacter soli TaxID=2910976 RepID=A0AA41QJ72_9MICO|nr:TadE/TadG family type IV pilus assembly protein [Antribacter soli]MCF4123710.1 pilus assembly protein [Antribacter soli]
MRRRLPGAARRNWERGRQRQRGQHDQEGSTSVELVVLLPALFGLLFLGVQAGLLFHARQIVLAAANEGAVAAAAEHSTATDGQATAEGFLTQAGDVALATWTVTATRDVDHASVRVEAVPYSIIPFYVPQVTGTAAMPTEEVRPIGGAP